MDKYFEIGSKQFNLDDIVSYGISNVRYIFRPCYRLDKSVKNKLTHNMYTLVSMKPYALFSDDIVLDDIPLLVVQSNGSIDEVDVGKVKSSTKNYVPTKVQVQDALVIVTDKEHYFLVLHGNLGLKRIEGKERYRIRVKK